MSFDIRVVVRNVVMDVIFLEDLDYKLRFGKLVMVFNLVENIKGICICIYYFLYLYNS